MITSELIVIYKFQVDVECTKQWILPNMQCSHAGTNHAFVQKMAYLLFLMQIEALTTV